MNNNQHFETLRKDQTVFKKAVKNGIINSPEYIQIASGKTVPIAQYNDYSNIDPYSRSLLAKALPPYLSESEFLTLANFYPKTVTDSDRKLPVHQKFTRATTAQKLYRVTTKSLTVFRKINQIIRSSYSDKMHAGETGNSAGGLTIYGLSSQGKTSAVNMALSYFPQIIAHKSQAKDFNKAALPTHENILQVTWLSIVCPSEGGQMSLCNNILAEVDDLLGTKYEEKFKRSLGRNTEIDLKVYISRVKQVIREINLGILVIDDIQLLAQKSKENRKQIANFLVELIGELEIPICLVGTLEVTSAFKELSFSFKSKFTKHGDIYFEPFPPNLETNKNKARDPSYPLAPEEYSDLIIFLFKRYQVTSNTLKIEELKEHHAKPNKNDVKNQLKISIIEQFYHETAGITQYTILLFIAIQQYIIEDELKPRQKDNLNKDAPDFPVHQKISRSLISKIAKQNFKINQRYLDAIRTGDTHLLQTLPDINFGTFRVSESLNTHDSDIDVIDAHRKYEERLEIPEQLKASLISSGVDEDLAAKAVEAVMGGYTNQSYLDLLGKCIENVKKLQENPNKPVRLSPEIERADITLDLKTLEPMDHFIVEQNENNNPELVPELLKKYGFGFDYEKDVDL